MTIELGFGLPQFGENAGDDVARFASQAEQLGAASLWTGDRLVVPVSPTVGYLGTDTIPHEMRAGGDAFVFMTAAAAATSVAKIGCSALVAPWYPPVLLARQLTSLDRVSGGRLIAGFGLGWSPDEYAVLGIDFTDRGAQLEEILDLLDKLWTTSPVEHQGQYHSLQESWVDLKPAQHPVPPIYLGTFSPSGLKRIGRRAQGWLPIVLPPGEVQTEYLLASRRVIDEAAVEAGRDPAEIGNAVRVNPAAGASLHEIADAIKILADHGFTHSFVDFMYLEHDVDRQLEWVEKLLSAVA